MTCLRGCILLLYYFRENLIRFHQKEAQVSSFERNQGFSIKILVLSKSSKYHAMPCHQFIQAILSKSRAMSGLSRMKESLAKEIPICAELKCSLISFSGKPPFSDIKSHPGTEQRQLYFDPLADVSSFPPSFSPVLLPWFSFSSFTKALLLLIFTCWNIAFSVLKGFATTSTPKCCFFLCFIISSFRLNPFSQTPHLFDFSPLCVLKCFLKLLA